MNQRPLNDKGGKLVHIRIYQINLDRDANHVAFVGTDRLERCQGSIAIDSTLYDKVFEGEVDCDTLEAVFQTFNFNHPKGYTGRSLSVSDIVEIVEDPIPGNFYFCDRMGFKHVAFQPEPSDSSPIYTRDEAADILDLFENVLDRYGIKVPSPEDDEREADDEAKLYGSVYYELLDGVENALNELFKRHTSNTQVIYGIFSGCR